MDINRLRNIISFSEAHGDAALSDVKKFRAIAGIANEDALLNIMQVARDVLHQKGLFFFELPLYDDEIGAAFYKDDGKGYVIVNTSLPEISTNFAIAHELYHVFFSPAGHISKIELTGEYINSEEESAANLFAGILLMPEYNFRTMYRKFNTESVDSFETIIKLMSYFRSPYMAVLIRCRELNLLQRITADLLCRTDEDIAEKFNELWFDDTILHQSGKNDAERIIRLLKKTGAQYVEDEYISQTMLDKALRNTDSLLKAISGGR